MVFRCSPRAHVLSLIITALVFESACKDDEKKPAASPPPASTSASGTEPGLSSAAAAAPAKDICASGGGDVKDPISSSFFPKAVAGFCIDPLGEARTYGEKGKLSMDEVCTTSFDGECEVYKSLSLKRYVGMRYVDGTGKPNSVDVGLSTFADSTGAYAMFTKRVVAGGDPAEATVHPLKAGAVGAIGKSNAYVWKGPYLVELAFGTDDTKMTEAEMTRMTAVAVAAVAQGIGERLPGDGRLPAAAAALPSQDQIPLGVSLLLPGPKAAPGEEAAKGALGMATFFPAAIGYYKTGTKRFRLEAVMKESASASASATATADATLMADRTKDLWKPLRAKAGVLPVANLGDDAALVVVQEKSGSPKVECVAARKGAGIYAVCDEETVLVPTDPAEKQATLRLTKDEKVAQLRSWLGTSAAVAVAPKK